MSGFNRILLLCPVLFLGSAGPASADADALWRIVNTCVVATAPCAKVDTAGHYALLKDQRGVAQYLLIPTDKITGIESPALLDPATPNFLAAAWAERSAVDARLPHPLGRDSVSLAVNAQAARSQNQLHIHIDCLSAEARDALKAAAATVGRQWQPLAEPIAGHRFAAIRVDGAALGTFNPFIALAATLADPAHEMASRNLVVVGTDFAEGPGFLVLSDVAPAAGAWSAGGEDVQDHSCAIDK
ncbi:MAG: CDP-diacylglycerol diphosphatase [Ancalomicrobiaceae bacterium]|nr:CDP-diacylglycerol diphosphatase [Ancalomicrobiaceae bacterium]